MSVAETSVAEMSWPKRPWPKCPWPKCPSTVVPEPFFRPIVVLDELSIRRNGFRRNVVHPNKISMRHEGPFFSFKTEKDRF